MDREHAPIRPLKHRWDEEDAARDELEERTKKLFLEQEANEIFSPIETYFTRLGKILTAAGAAVELDAMWEHLGDRKLRRVAKVMPRSSVHHLRLDLTIEGLSIFYRDKPYRFLGGIEALMRVITSDVEQFLNSFQGQVAGS